MSPPIFAGDDYDIGDWTSIKVVLSVSYHLTVDKLIPLEKITPVVTTVGKTIQIKDALRGLRQRHTKDGLSEHNVTIPGDIIEVYKTIGIPSVGTVQIARRRGDGELDVEKRIWERGLIEDFLRRLRSHASEEEFRIDFVVDVSKARVRPMAISNLLGGDVTDVA